MVDLVGDLGGVAMPLSTAENDRLRFLLEGGLVGLVGMVGEAIESVMGC